MAGTLLTLTDAGRAALIGPDNTGTAMRRVNEVGFAGAPFEPAGSLQTLPHEIKRVSTIAGENVAPDTIHVTIRDDGPDQFVLYGFGLYLDNGVLLGTYCQPTPIMEKSSVAILLLSTDVRLVTVDATRLTFGDASFTNPPATTERQGVVELATAEETRRGTDAGRAVTPAGLAARTANEERAGLIRIASQAEIAAGTDNSAAVTPGNLARRLATKAALAGSADQTFAVADATSARHAVPLAQADKRYASPQAVANAQATADRAKSIADAALPSSGGRVTGPVEFDVRPTIAGQVPYDTGNLPNPLTTDGGTLKPDKGMATRTSYGKFAYRVSPNGTNSIGGAFVAWNAERTPALQIDCPDNQAAYMGIRWTQWGKRHIAAIDAYAGGGDSSPSVIVLHLADRNNAWTFNASDITRGAGGQVWGSWNFDPAGKADRSYADAINAAVATKASTSHVDANFHAIYNSLNSKATAGAAVQRHSGTVEFGRVFVGITGSSVVADVPAPYVMTGLRAVGDRTGGSYIYLRAATLRNQ
ncbi:hypothetical protein [Pandoraea sp.]|uniref:hypothetical protein n=1 Tax=Pandoraea sp. TaxID=1883445 RepID=UPI0012256C9B|nr:hypothetical protein [Pandoraea sp.]TAL53815.1 MAG: hypothetical protein EPN80_14200 [Pandoraea sp.]TAM17068.1 MAG: hypothetical protein EPN65_12370 [Pandoraea sp.]